MPENKIESGKKRLDYKKIIWLFLAWRVALFIVAYFAHFTIAKNSGTLFPDDIHPLLAGWILFDCNWFTDIAKYGYVGNLSTAFFPLWPLVILLFSKIFFFFNIKLVAFGIANLLTLVCCLLFYKVVSINHEEQIAFRSVKYFLFFPMSFFMATNYSEPLFLLLVLGSFYFAITNQKLLASVSAIGAGLTRLVGTTMAVPLAIEFFIQKNNLKEKIKNLIFLLLIPTGILIYMFYLKKTFSDPFVFSHVQAHWQREIGLKGFADLFKQIKFLFSFRIADPNYPSILIQPGSVLLFLIILLTGIKKLRISYLVYSLLMILIPLSSGNLLSINRFLIVVFPFFIALSYLGRRKWVDTLATFVFLMLLGYFTALFTNGWWVA